MTENSSESSSNSNFMEDGIQLALDPNLITLPLHGSVSSPLTNAPNSNVQASENGNPDQIDVDAGPVNGNNDTGQSLINNPYGLFGQMPLEHLIPLVLQQKGFGFKFADLSEDALEEEIEGDRSGGSDNARPDLMDVDPSENKVEEVPPETLAEDNQGTTKDSENKVEIITQEQFMRMRREMIEHINIAMNESSLALEFLSLLLSSVRESVALSSMSPFLKKIVPVASLNGDKVSLEPQTVEEQLTMQVIDRGWKIRCLNESRTLLKENHSMLEEKLKSEHRYWKKVLQYISNKDVVFKLRDRSTGLRSLGIKYGYEDSGSTYRFDRGVAILKTNPETNTLELVPITGENSPSTRNEKFIRIRIFTKIEFEDDYILSGESSVDNVFLNSDSSGKKDQEDIRSQIEKLKALIFEQELMYQLRRECAQLISYGVTIENEKKIVIELPNEKFEIELVSLDDASVVNHEQDAPKINDRRANLMLVTIRMLLVVMFKKNLRQRLTSSIRHTHLNVDKDILLIRPLLGKMRHQNYKLLLKKILKIHVLDVVENSTLSETAIFPSSYQNGDDADLDIHIAKLNQEISTFDRLLTPCKTQFDAKLSDKGELSLTLESPNYCNLAVRVFYQNEPKNVFFDTRFSEFKEVEEILHFIVNEYIKKT
ncbi:RNA polymerase II mediator complex subunit [Zygosaccharomyces mellis]|uniref:Mediator of RNA polymerase II transcription subunit 17 n=1 Tax=Zygosaccharomyces mellis TaxID=42258 RepID=A0A4C2E7L3_9SACH|nr:RNA polymerase II mediator complex subunit [Zygosaccharomyces mellis]